MIQVETNFSNLFTFRQILKKKLEFYAIISQTLYYMYTVYFNIAYYKTFLILCYLYPAFYTHFKFKIKTNVMHCSI